MKSIQRNQGGFSLVEILLVLGIIAILAIAAFIIFPQVQASNRANTEQTNITTLAAGIKNLYGATRNYTGISATVVNQARIAPASMNGGDPSATTLSSSWSGDVAIAPSAAVAGPPAIPAVSCCSGLPRRCHSLVRSSPRSAWASGCTSAPSRR